MLGEFFAARREFGNGYVSCLWLGGGTNRVAEEFALRMRSETGCPIADVNGYRVIEPGELAGLNGQVSGEQSARREDKVICGSG